MTLRRKVSVYTPANVGHQGARPPMLFQERTDGSWTGWLFPVTFDFYDKDGALRSLTA